MGRLRSTNVGGKMVGVRWLPLIATLVAAIVLAIVGTTPPMPRGDHAPGHAFSAERAMTHVEIIGERPHPTGSQENARVRSYLVTELRALEFDVEEKQFPLPQASTERMQSWSEGGAAPTTGTNVIARSGPVDRGDALLLMAHYDSVWGSPAAADDGAGVAAILEIVRALQTAEKQRGLIVLFTDAEELGLDGAEAFFDRNPLAGSVGAVVNLETRGGGGRATMFETEIDNGDAMRLFKRAVSRPAASSLSVAIYRLMPNSSDLTEALGRGYIAYNFAFIGRPALYHSPMATPANLDQGSLQDIGAQALDLARDLLAASQLPGRSADRVFFDLFGLLLVAYAPALGWAVLGLAAIALVAAVFPGFRARAFFVGLGRSLLLLLASGGLLYLLNLASGADGPVNYFDRLAAISRLEAIALLVAAALIPVSATLLSGSSVRGGVKRNDGTSAMITGSALPILFVGIAAQIVLPPAAYPFAWPALFAGGAALISRYFEGGSRLIPCGILAVPVVGYSMQFGHQLVQAVGPDLLPVAAIPALLAAIMLWPLLPRVPKRGVWTTAAALMTAAVILALWIRLDPVAETAAVYSRFY